MTETIQTRATKIKGFEQKFLNRSFIDLRFYDKLADYMLQCCNAEAKPNTLSLFSFLPLFILSFVVTGPSTVTFLITILGILLHQLFDIANKKQAYRLSQFSLNTFYIDHLFDSLSLSFLILIICKLLELTASSTLMSIYFFGMLPFYTHHLAMYNDDYLTFPLISPTSEGLVLLKLLFLVGAFYPALFSAQIANGVQFYQVFIGLAMTWLLIFVLLDLKTIIQGKRVTDSKSGIIEEYPLKNLFAIFMIGYVIMEITSIQPILLDDPLYFYFTFGTLAITFTHILNNLVLSYGYNQKYKQITLPFLIVIGIIVLYYFTCAFALGGEEIQNLISKIVMGVTFFTLLLFFIRETWKKISEINLILSA